MGNITQIAYDSRGRIIGITNPDGTAASYDYDVKNNTVTYTDELGNITSYIYNEPGNLIRVYDVTGSHTLSAKTYDGLDRLTEETVYSSIGGNKTTYYYYDTQNRLIETGKRSATGSLLSRTTYVHLDGSGKTTKTVVGDFNAPSIVTTEYKNNMGFVTSTGKMLNGTEYKDTYTYDYVGNRLTEKTAYTASLGGSYTNSYTYDYAGRVLTATNALGRLIQKKKPFASSGGTTYYTEVQYLYDLNGNIVSQKTADSAPGETLTYAQTDYDYDSRNRLVMMTTHDGGAAENYTQYYYDALGNTLRMYTGLSAPLTISGLDAVSGTDTDYSVTRYVYDQYSNVTSTTDPLGQTETYTYDINGNMLTKTHRSGAMTTYTYDGLGRVTNTAVETSDGEGDGYVAYSYTLTGQALSQTNGTETSAYAYDSLGRVTQEATGKTVKTYGYNLGNSRTGFLLTQDGAQQMSILYDYDALNRLTGVTSGTVTAEYGYDTNGNQSYVEYDSGVREEYTYNLANLLTTLVNEDSSGTALSQYEYTYTLDGNQVSKTDQSGKITAYTYDGLGRLTGESESVAGSTLQSYAYTYDDYNNRATLTATGTEAYATAYAYDANNRLLTVVKTNSDCVDTTTYYYDLNGNQVAEVTERVAEATGSESIALTEGVAGSRQSRYNGFNQLVETSVDGTEVAYTYFPSGLRASKTVDAVTTEFVLDGDSAVLELVSDSVTALYVRGINLVYGVIGSDESYYLYNGHGDVVQLTDSTGSVTREYNYDSFGVELGAVQGDTNPFRYCGEYYDLETKTYYLRARNYDPTTGRFLSEDTNAGKATDPLSLNLYAYCWNNPVLYIDASGNLPTLTEATRASARWLIANPAAVYATQQGWFSKAFYAAGFVRDSGGVYHARQDALQQYGGYNDFYDSIFNAATSMDKAKFQFSMNGQDYIFWAWKGDYLNLGAGAELGIYTRFSSTDHWLVDTSLALPMTLTLNDNNGNQILSFSPSNNQWWITGFNPYYQDVQASNLIATYTVNFSGNKDMYDKFYSTWRRDKRWTFDSKNYKATLTF